MGVTCKNCNHKVVPKADWHGGREIFFCPLCLSPFHNPTYAKKPAEVAQSLRMSVNRRDRRRGKVRRLSEEEIRREYGR